MKRLVSLGLLGMLGCKDAGNDSGRLEGSGLPGVDGKIYSAEVPNEDNAGPRFTMDYQNGSNNLATVTFEVFQRDLGLVTVDDAGQYNDETKVAEIYVSGEGIWSGYDGTWKFRDDILLEYGINIQSSGLENWMNDINDAIYNGEMVVCESPDTSLTDLEPKDFCIINGGNVPDSFYDDN